MFRNSKAKAVAAANVCFLGERVGQKDEWCEGNVKGGGEVIMAAYCLY